MKPKLTYVTVLVPTINKRKHAPWEGWKCQSDVHCAYGRNMWLAYAKWVVQHSEDERKELIASIPEDMRRKLHDELNEHNRILSQMRGYYDPTRIRRAGPYGDEFGRIVDVEIEYTTSTRWQRIKEWIFDRM